MLCIKKTRKKAQTWAQIIKNRMVYLKTKLDQN